MSYKEGEWPCEATEVTCTLQFYRWARGSEAISSGLVTVVELLHMTVAVEDSATLKMASQTKNICSCCISMHPHALSSRY